MVADPTTPGIYDEIRRAVSVAIRLAVAAPDLIEVAIDNAYADQRLRTAEVVDATETLEARAEEGDGSETGFYLTGVPESAEPPVTSGQHQPGWRVLGSLLLRDGLVTELDLETALAQQRLSSTRRLGEILIQRGAVTETQVARALAEQHELPFVDLAEHDLDLDAAARLPIAFAREYRVLPVSHLLGGGSLLVVTADPARAVQSDELRAALDCPFQLAVAAAAEIDAALAVVERTGQILASVPEPDPTPDPDSVPEQLSEAALALQPEWSSLPDLPVHAAELGGDEPWTLEAGAVVEPEVDAEAEIVVYATVEPEVEARVDADDETAETEMESDIGPEAETETEAVLQAADETVETEMESQFGAETEALPQAADETIQTALESDIGTEPEVGARVEVDDEPAETEMESDIGPAAEMETEAVPQATDETAETEMESDIGPAAEMETEAVPQAADETAETEMESDIGPEAEMETEVVAQAADETVETEMESDIRPEAEMDTPVVAQTNFDDEAGAEVEAEIGGETQVEVATAADLPAAGSRPTTRPRLSSRRSKPPRTRSRRSWTRSSPHSRAARPPSTSSPAGTRSSSTLGSTVSLPRCRRSRSPSPR